ncbi:MAG: Eco57I restriction-modification methylase domain-containing protein, partial [Pseudomonadota bacterium]
KVSHRPRRTRGNLRGEHLTLQLTMNLPVALPRDAYQFGARSSGETHGVVLTKPHMVDLILDLAAYTVDRDLTRIRLLEPACGHGAFLLPTVERLLTVAKRQGRSPEDLRDAITAYDIDLEHVATSRRAVADVLTRHAVSARLAASLAAGWVHEGDFLLAHDTATYDAVVGNPPYVRIEQLAPALQQEYRRRFSSIYDRADLYVAFIEHGLNLLGPNGILSFVCADRWTLNRYGAPLRDLIARRFQVRCYIDLHHASPFESEVIAYPAIFAIGRSKTGSATDLAADPVTVATLKTASAEECRAVIQAMTTQVDATGVATMKYESWFRGDEPWVLSTPEQLAVLRKLEDQFEPIETGDTRVGIGVATGNDKLYIVGADADIEADRLVPLVMRDDIEAGRIRDSQRFVINTFRQGAQLIDLREYPRLGKYLRANGDAIRARHVARKNEKGWFRTIDRVYPELVKVPKLLIPDIAGANEVVLDEGRFHPHHNLYFVTSGSWDMRVLGALLSSKVALFFVWSYAVKMRGGYLRFQAQYLRRIRLPAPGRIKVRLAKGLATAFEKRDFGRLDDLTLEAYGLKALPEFDFVDTRS